MTSVSTRFAVPSTQGSAATRNDRLATLASRVEDRVNGVCRALVNVAGKGFASKLSEVMRWRIERRSRELNGVEKLSLADVVAEIELHLVNDDQDAANAIMAALVDGLCSASVPVTPGSVVRVFDEGGQLYMRFDR